MRLYATPRTASSDADEEHVGRAAESDLRASRMSGSDAAEEDLGGEGHAEPSGEGSGELVADRHVAEAEPEVDERAPRT